MSLQKIIITFIVFLGIGFSACLAQAQEESYKITIENHQFSPEVLVIPAGQKVKIVVENLDPTPEEFESFDLNREKVVAGKAAITIFIGPLKPGTYEYFGEFHQDTAQGTILVKEEEK